MGDVGSAFLGGFFGGDPGSNLVDTIGGKEDIFGSRPDVAPFTPVDLSAETGKAVAGNILNYPDITALLDKIMPGFSDSLAQIGENTFSELQGHLPQDVQDQVYRSSAFKSLMGGFGGTGMGKALAARDLGLTSLNLTEIGKNSAQTWADIAEKAYAPFTTSTSEQAGTTAANNAGIQAQKQFEFNVAASPDPGAAGIFALDKDIGDQFLSFGLGAAGGAIAGGGAAGARPTGGGLFTYDPRTGQYVPQTTTTTTPTGYSWAGGAG